MQHSSDSTPKNPERPSNSEEWVAQVEPASVWAGTGVGVGCLNGMLPYNRFNRIFSARSLKPAWQEHTKASGNSWRCF
jgi:hypothetical protein